MTLTLDISAAELLAVRRVIDAERSGDSHDSADGITRDRVMRRLVVQWAIRVKPARTGKCIGCGCTETDPCHPPCHWVNKSQTLCNACADA